MNIRASDITNASFVVQWNDVDGANGYIVKWRDGDDGEAKASQTSCTVRGLTPNTIYHVTVTARNICGRGASSNFFVVTTSGMTALVTPLLSSIASTTSPTSTITIPTGTC